MDKDFSTSTDRTPAANSTYKKLAFQWLNEALCFVSSSVVADSFVLRNRQLLVAANRYMKPVSYTNRRKTLEPKIKQYGNNNF
ncbi:hypothetical protein [Flavobacterium sp.]|uniref:hypothetical protein n=1 Tax=Flavobacterium sp. TaxID=239 RepID=UPI0025D09122|nr:hypothetical protein [Flavobacterium sp.]